jgi:hypothetical protein
MGQSNWLIAKTKSWTCEAPQPINMKQNKCEDDPYVPQFLPMPLAQAKIGDKQFWK